MQTSFNVQVPQTSCPGFCPADCPACCFVRCCPGSKNTACPGCFPLRCPLGCPLACPANHLKPCLGSPGAVSSLTGSTRAYLGHRLSSFVRGHSDSCNPMPEHPGGTPYPADALPFVNTLRPVKFPANFKTSGTCLMLAWPASPHSGGFPNDLTF